MKLQPELEKYLLENLGEIDPVLVELERETHLKVLQPRMLSGHLQGNMLTMFAKMVNPSSILEVGTFTGYSAICLAKGLAPGGKLVTIEIDDELNGFAYEYFKKAGISGIIEQKTGSAIEVIPQLKETFGLVFLDGDKKEYCQYYNLVFEKVVPGGYIIADNTLWDGKVIEPLKPKDEQTKRILEFNKLVASDKRVEKVMLPVRDGITIIRKI